MESFTNGKNLCRLVVNPGSPIRGEICSSGADGIPGDKSISHRAALFSAFAEGESIIENFQVSGVTIPMLNALTKVGVDWNLSGARLTVRGKGLSGFQLPQSGLDCGNSATSMRLLAGALSASGIPAILDGSEGLRRRPMNRIIEPLSKMGVQISSKDGCAPIHLGKSHFPLLALRHELAIASAQVKSCILLAALAAEGESIVVEPGFSRDHTERMLRGMGVDIKSETKVEANQPRYVTIISPEKGKSLLPLHMMLPGDFSAAAFLLVAACITPGSDLVLRGVGMNPTRTGLLEALLVMGARIDILSFSEQGGEPVGDLHIRSGDLTGTVISGDLVVRMIDEFPIFAIAAAYAHGITEVKDAAELRMKESDRISDLCSEIRLLGVEVYENPDGFRIVGGKLIPGCKVNSHLDHRLAMSLTVAGLGALSKVEIDHAEVVYESFPSFVEILSKLGAIINEQGMQD
jgi:3-phosphoshikimate 1-carboxyvinyltransferase